jgi:hypothetical protein
VLVVVDKLLARIIDEVEVTPLTIEVAVLEAMVKLLVVVAIKLARLVVEITPFTLLVNIPVEVANEEEFSVMIVEVATTPLTVEVRVFPVAD